MSVNSVQLLGHLGKNPVMTTTKSGVPVCNFSVATTDRWTDKTTGQKKEHTEWHNVVCFGKLAEIAGQYLRTGSQVFLTGSLATEKYVRDGQTHYSTKIKMSDLQLLGSAKSEQQPMQQAQQPMQQQPMQQGYVQQPMQQLPQQQVVQQMAMPQQPMQQMQVQPQQMPMANNLAPTPSDNEWVWDNHPVGY